MRNTAAMWTGCIRCQRALQLRGLAGYATLPVLQCATNKVSAVAEDVTQQRAPATAFR